MLSVRYIAGAALIPLLLLLFPAFVFSYEIKGKIIDAESGKPVENVIIRVQGISVPALSAADGTFSISVGNEDVYKVQFSRMGYDKEIRKLRLRNEDLFLTVKLVPAGIRSATVIVSGTRYDSEFAELNETANTLEGDELQRGLGMTLAETLKNETGIAVSSMGPAPARPVIRGLSGERVLITEDGVPVNDLSASSPDHAVSMEAFAMEKIEVVRGPKVLMYSTNTLGGTVNAQNRDIPEIMPHSINGQISGYYESANSGWLGAAKLSVPGGNFLTKGSFSYKKAEDISSPDRTLDNTGLLTRDYSLGSSYIEDEFMAGASFREFYTDYGIPGGFVGAHPDGVDIEMRRRDYEASTKFHTHTDAFDNIEIKFRRSFYEHTEYESSGAIGSEFVSGDIFAKVLVNHSPFGIINSGAYGIEIDYRDLKHGGFVFTPNTVSGNAALWLYEDMKIGSWLIQAGARYSFISHDPETEGETPIGVIRDRNFHLFSASAAAMREFGEHIYLGASLSRTSRAPAPNELYSRGPHLAAYSFETGNPSLDQEYGYGAEIFSYHRNENVFGMMNFFYYDFQNYISYRNTGEINYQQLLPIYKASGIKARLAGAELSADFILPGHLTLSGNISYTYGENMDENNPLPMIPPVKGFGELAFKPNGFAAALKAEFAGPQKRVDSFEESTDGYVIFGGYLQYKFMSGSFVHSVVANFDNIFNTTYRNHLSRIKSIMPEPGFNLRLIYRAMI